MEVHRIKGMVSNYDPKKFEELYYKTEGLRKKLNSQIDHHRFGLAPEDTLSWFDDKFILVFNKYYHLLGTYTLYEKKKVLFTDEVLLGHIIKSLQIFKFRILRGAYTYKSSQKIIQIETPEVISDLFIEDSNTTAEYYKNKLSKYLKTRLTDDAFYLMDIQLNPPPFILERINEGPDMKKLGKISDELLLDYFGLEVNKKTLKFLSGLKNEIKIAIEEAKVYFR